MPIVYMATNRINGKRYIGATKHSVAHRRSKHASDAKANRPGCRVFNAAIRRYGMDAFEWSILLTVDSYPEVMAAEVRLISELRPEYNITSGGQGIIGLVRTKEWLEKTSKALKGRKPSPQCYEANTHEHQLKSVVCLNDGKFFESIKDAAAYYEIRKKSISEMLRGSYTKCIGLSFAFSDTELDDKERSRRLVVLHERVSSWKERQNKDKRRPVVCLSDGKEYPGVTMTAKAYGISPMRVVQICQKGGTTKDGLSFRYADSDAVQKRIFTEDEQKFHRAQSIAALRRGQAKIKKPVICVDTGQEFDSISNAARALGLGIKSLSAAIIRGNVCGGMRFQMVNK